MLSSRFPRRALRHVLRGFRKNGSSPEATRDHAGSLSRTINEISAKGLLALAVSWSLAEIALVFTTPTTPIEERIVELPLASPPIMEVAETSRQMLLTPATFLSSGE
jgi:hypothetical protein